MPANQYACIMCLSLLSTYNMWAACTSIYMYWKTYSYTDQSSKLFVCIKECTVVLIDFRFIHKTRSNKTILKPESLHVVWLHYQLFCSINLLYIERCFYLQSWMMAKKRHWDPARIRIWVLWILVIFRSFSGSLHDSRVPHSKPKRDPAWESNCVYG